MNWTWKDIIILYITFGAISYIIDKLPIYILSLLIGVVIFSVEHLIGYTLYKREIKEGNINENITQTILYNGSIN